MMGSILIIQSRGFAARKRHIAVQVAAVSARIDVRHCRFGSPLPARRMQTILPLQRLGHRQLQAFALIAINRQKRSFQANEACMQKNLLHLHDRGIHLEAISGLVAGLVANWPTNVVNFLFCRALSGADWGRSAT